MADVGVLDKTTVIELPERTGAVECQWKGKGKFVALHLSLVRGELTFRKRAGDKKAVRTGSALGCKVDVPKKARKGHEHAFRVDLATKDSEKILKYVISASNAIELKDWMECFGVYSSMTVEDVEAAVRTATAVSNRLQSPMQPCK